MLAPTTTPKSAEAASRSRRRATGEDHAPERLADERFLAAGRFLDAMLFFADAFFFALPLVVRALPLLEPDPLLSFLGPRAMGVRLA